MFSFNSPIQLNSVEPVLKDRLGLVSHGLIVNEGIYWILAKSTGDKISSQIPRLETTLVIHIIR